MSDLPMVEPDTARVSVLPVAGCKFPAVFLGKVPLDVVGLGVGPPWLRVDSEETLLTLIDERTQLVCAAPGVTPEDGSVEGAPVLELIEHSVLGKPLDDSLQEPMPVMNRLEHPLMLPDTTLDGRPMEGTTYLEHSALGVSLDNKLIEGMSRLEPFEQSVLSTLLIAQTVGVLTETDTPERSALASK